MKKLLSVTLSLALFSIFSSSIIVQAQEPLDNWIAQSSVLVDQKMYYPKFAIRKDHTGVSYVTVTIDQVGNILKSEITGKSGSTLLDRASLKAVKKINQFPAIPAIERFDKEMTFGVELTYDLSYSGADHFRKTRALSPLSAKIEIIE